MGLTNPILVRDELFLLLIAHTFLVFIRVIVSFQLLIKTFQHCLGAVIVRAHLQDTHRVQLGGVLFELGWEASREHVVDSDHESNCCKALYNHFKHAFLRRLNREHNLSDDRHDHLHEAQDQS